MKPVARNIERFSLPQAFLCTEAAKSPQQLWQVIDSRPRVALLAAAVRATRGRWQHYSRPRIDDFFGLLAKRETSLGFFVEMQQAYVEMEKGKAYTEFLCVCIESCEISETQPCCSFRGVLKCVARTLYVCRSHPFSRLFFF